MTPDNDTAPDWILQAARARGPVSPGHYRVVVVEMSAEVSVTDFGSREAAEQYANDAASEAEHPFPVAYVFSDSLQLVARGKHYASR